MILAAVVPVAFAADQLTVGWRVVAAVLIGTGALVLCRGLVRARGVHVATAAYALGPLIGAPVSAFLGMARWVHPPSRHERTNFRSGSTVAGIAVGALAGAIGLVAILGSRTTPGFGGYADPLDWARPILGNPVAAIGVVLVASAINALAEEWLFRHFIEGQLLASGTTLVPAVLISSASFGAAHFGTGLPGGLVGAWLSALFGLILGIAYARMKEPRPFILSAHFSADVLILGYALLLSS